MKKIDFEAHFWTEEYLDALRENKGFPQFINNKETGSPELCFDNDVVMLMGDRICNKLLDIGEGRLKDMDANGIDVQVLSGFIGIRKSFPVFLYLLL